MNAVSIISVCFGGISLVVSIILSVRTVTRDTRKDTAEEAKTKEEMKASLLELNLMVKGINATTNDIKSDVKALGKNVNDMDTRLTLLERDQKTMWLRLDEVKEKVNG